MTGCGREPHLHVYPERAMWRWTYHVPADEDGRGDGLALQASIAYADAEEARSSATTAYPGIPVADDDGQVEDSAPEQESRGGHRCRRTVPAALAVAILVATAVIILRQRAVDDHGGPAGRRAPDAEGSSPGLSAGFRPGFRLGFRLGRRGYPLGTRRAPAPQWDHAVMVDRTKCSAALPRRRRARRVGGR